MYIYGVVGVALLLDAGQYKTTMVCISKYHTFLLLLLTFLKDDVVLCINQINTNGDQFDLIVGK